jgi:hypothetical protein
MRSDHLKSPRALSAKPKQFERCNPFYGPARNNGRPIWPIHKENISMKNLLIILLALTVAMSVTAVAQDSGMASSAQSTASAPLKTLKGTVKAEGDKVMFVNDKDGKSWDVMNPEELKGHEGHHVQLSAHVYADKNAIHVMSVKMLKGGAKDSMSK